MSTILTFNVIPARAGNELEIIVLARARRSDFFTEAVVDCCERPDDSDYVSGEETLILALAATLITSMGGDVAGEGRAGSPGSRSLALAVIFHLLSP